MIDRAAIHTLVTAAAEGDRGALRPLYAAMWDPFVAFATRFLGDRTTAEDCAQDALVRLFGQLDRFDRERDGLAWAFAILAWECRTVRRKRDRRGEESEAGCDVQMIDARGSLEDRDLARAAMSALDMLSERDAEVISALITDDDALRATIAPATFRKRLERALDRLRVAWRSRHGDA